MRIFVLLTIFFLFISSYEKTVGECANDLTNESMNCSKQNRDPIKLYKCIIKYQKKYVSCLETASDYPKIS